MTHPQGTAKEGRESSEAYEEAKRHMKALMKTEKSARSVHRRGRIQANDCRIAKDVPSASESKQAATHFLRCRQSDIVLGRRHERRYLWCGREP